MCFTTVWKNSLEITLSEHLVFYAFPKVDIFSGDLLEVDSASNQLIWTHPPCSWINWNIIIAMFSVATPYYWGRKIKTISKSQAGHVFDFLNRLATLFFYNYRTFLGNLVFWYKLFGKENLFQVRKGCTFFFSGKKSINK